MSQVKHADSILAFKLYNKKNATREEIDYAKKLINNVKFESLNLYGKFVWAEIRIENCHFSERERAKACKFMQNLTKSKDLSTKMLVVANFFVGYCYELGIGTEQNRYRALRYYLRANKLNKKACRKDIARLKAKINPAKPEYPTATPDEFKYHFTSDELDYGLTDMEQFEMHRYLRDLESDHAWRMINLEKTGFYYPDDPDEVSVDDLELYCVKGVTLYDLLNKRRRCPRYDPDYVSPYQKYYAGSVYRYDNLEAWYYLDDIFRFYDTDD